MKGVMFTAKGITELIDEPKPECGEDEVLLKTLFSVSAMAPSGVS